MVKLLRSVSLLLLTLFLAACSPTAALDSATALCRSVGMCDKPTVATGTADILCDASLGSSFSAKTLGTVLDDVLPWAVQRPGTTIRLWDLGNTVAETVLVGEYRTPVPTKRNARARRAYEDEVVNAARTYFLKSAEPILNGPGKRRSPLFEAITKIAVAREPVAGERRFVVITDGREVSTFGDFECGPLPSPTAFVNSLRRQNVLMTGMLAETSVHLVGVTMGNVHGGRCAVTVQRELAIRDLWRVALSGAGATRIDVTVGSAQMITQAEREGR